MTATELAPYGVAIISMDGHITYADAFYASLAGRTPDEMIGRHVEEFADMAGGYSRHRVLNLLLRTEQPILMRRSYLKEDGTRTECDVQLCVLRDVAGTVHSILAVVQAART